MRAAMRRRFLKMHGLGNDFVIFDARETPLEMDETRARALADRRTGIGCDQLIVLEPSEAADVRMRIWNSDGGEVQACGTAARCVATPIGGECTTETEGGACANAAGGVATLIAGECTIETAGGLISGEAAQSPATIDMGGPRFGW